MRAATASRSPITRLLLPGTAAAGHPRAFVSRDGRGCPLEGAAALNRFPASAHCTITWFLAGGAELVECGGTHLQHPLARCAAGGCQSAPVVPQNVGEVQAFIAMFDPDAFHALFDLLLASIMRNFGWPSAWCSGAWPSRSRTSPPRHRA